MTHFYIVERRMSARYGFAEATVSATPASERYCCDSRQAIIERFAARATGEIRIVDGFIFEEFVTEQTPAIERIPEYRAAGVRQII